MVEIAQRLQLGTHGAEYTPALFWREKYENYPH